MKHAVTRIYWGDDEHVQEPFLGCLNALFRSNDDSSSDLQMALGHLSRLREALGRRSHTTGIGEALDNVEVALQARYRKGGQGRNEAAHLALVISLAALENALLVSRSSD